MGKSYSVKSYVMCGGIGLRRISASLLIAMTLLRYRSDARCAAGPYAASATRIKGKSRREILSSCLTARVHNVDAIPKGAYRCVIVEGSLHSVSDTAVPNRHFRGVTACSAPLSCLEILLSPYSLCGGNGDFSIITSATSRVW